MSFNMQRQRSGGMDRSTPIQRNGAGSAIGERRDLTRASADGPSRSAPAERHSARPSGIVGFGDYGTSEAALSQSDRWLNPSDPYASSRTSGTALSRGNRWPDPSVPYESHRTSEPAPSQSNEGPSRHAGISRNYEYPAPPHPPPSVPSNGTSWPNPLGNSSEYYAGRRIDRSLEHELDNATMVIQRDPSNYKGYERKHALLNSMGRYTEAFSAFDAMISRIEQSPDPQIRALRGRYLDTTPLIRKVVQGTISDIPHVLIDVTTGRLCGKKLQAAAFEERPIFNELRSSMTTDDQLDYQRIKREVEKFYEYVMFSHKWQPPEPTFQMVKNVSIYALPRSPTNNKLISFIELVNSRRFRWAWSDTCCVDQADRGVQQEAILAMFKWYRRATLTIVHLLGVLSGSQRKGSLWQSIWNTRGWTYQEYVASKVVQFYTEDWKPYLGLDIFNHKDSPFIRSEMEHVTRFAADQLATLQPGSDMVREKLYLASRRQTTREEDIAYSLFGIFDVANHVMYGEGNKAVGRLLEKILTRSANVTILAWTGIAGSYHSCLPADLTVYHQIDPPHIPKPIEAAAMNRMVTELRSSFPGLSLIVRLYNQLHDLSSLSLVSGRLKLPCFVFSVTGLTPLSGPEPNSGLYVYRAKTPILGDVWIETKDSSLRKQSLVLVHPWIGSLIDEDFSGGRPLFDLPTRALRLVARLRQPFGALLLASQGRVQYKRVAADSFIEVQVRAETPLQELISSIHKVDVQ